MVASRALCVLQANLRKSSETQLSLLNDRSLQSCDLLMISEPYLFLMNDTVCSHTHANWTPLWPSQRHPPFGGLRPYRSMVWVNKKTLPHRQIAIASADIAGVLLFTPSPTLAISVYIPPGRGCEGTRTLTQGLDAIREAHHRAQCEYGDNIDTLIVGDFNRHDQLWGGNQVATRNRQGEAEPIVLLMADWGLTSLLPRGIFTREEGPHRSTIDTVLASTDLSRRVTRCRIHPGRDCRALDWPDKRSNSPAGPGCAAIPIRQTMVDSGVNGIAKHVHMGSKPAYASSAVWSRSCCTGRHRIVPTEPVPSSNPWRQATALERVPRQYRQHLESGTIPSAGRAIHGDSPNTALG